eukprot:364786-Chlamydomonas_euryale.AAC.25
MHTCTLLAWCHMHTCTAVQCRGINPKAGECSCPCLSSTAPRPQRLRACDTMHACMQPAWSHAQLQSPSHQAARRRAVPLSLPSLSCSTAPAPLFARNCAW